MRPRKAPSEQLSFLAPTLREQLNPKEALYILAEKLDWEYFEREFSVLYSEEGRPAKPIRLMVGLMLLKSLENLSDEEVVKRWTRDPYYQYFCGGTHFQWELPIDPSDLTYFRKRLGKDGVEKIFTQSVVLHGDKAREAEVIIDTTVQEKNITYPVDSKQHVKIINKCAKIAKAENIKQRRSYIRTVGKLRFDLRSSTTSQGRKRRRRAMRLLKTIAGRVVRELERKMSKTQLEKHKDKLEIYKAFLAQKIDSKNKIYSLHEPHVTCYAKGKDSKKYEFGSKASLVLTKTSGIIVSAVNFSEGIHDSNTIEKSLDLVTKTTGQRPDLCIGDQGYNGKDNVGGTKILTVKSPKKLLSDQQIKERKKNLKRRSSIEPIISHLKFDHRLNRNFLKGVLGDSINLLMAACAFNLKKWINQVIFRLFLRLLAKIKVLLLTTLLTKCRTF